MSEMKYVVFASLFLVVMSIFASVFGKQVIDDSVDPDVKDFLKTIGVLDIPILGPLINFFQSTYTFVYVHPYLGMILGTLFGVPLAYVIVRLIRSGG